MERNDIREALPHRLDVADLEYDIKRLSAERDYHKSKIVIFEQTIKAQVAELDGIFSGVKHSTSNEEIYKWNQRKSG